MGGHARGWARMLGLFWLLAAVVFAGGCAASRPGLREPAVFRATADDRARADALLESMLRAEALYTLAGGIKPLSTGFWDGQVVVGDPKLEELTATRRALRLFESEYPAFEAGVMTFATTYEGERHLDAFVAHRESLRAMLARHSGFWAPYGLCVESRAEEVVNVVERMEKLDRFRGYGYLFGYPDEAVDFFVEAARQQEETGKFVERDFRQVPTIESPTGRFTWAVAKGAEVTPGDQRLFDLSARAMAAYRELEPLPVRARLRGLARWAAAQPAPYESLAQRP